MVLGQGHHARDADLAPGDRGAVLLLEHLLQGVTELDAVLDPENSDLFTGDSGFAGGDAGLEQVVEAIEIGLAGNLLDPVQADFPANEVEQLLQRLPDRIELAFVRQGLDCVAFEATTERLAEITSRVARAIAHYRTA